MELVGQPMGADDEDDEETVGEMRRSSQRWSQILGFDGKCWVWLTVVGELKDDCIDVVAVVVVSTLHVVASISLLLIYHSAHVRWLRWD